MSWPRARQKKKEEEEQGTEGAGAVQHDFRCAANSLHYLTNSRAQQTRNRKGSREMEEKQEEEGKRSF